MSAFDGYSYYINNDSDEEEIGSDSSDEEQMNEVDVILRGTPEQRCKVLKRLTGDEASSSDDDFEKVMKGELDAKVKALENGWRKPDEREGTSSKPDTGEVQAGSSNTKYYDDIYFDSDDEGKCKKQRMTNDELLYDPSADDEDQKWVDKQRNRVKKKSKGNTKPAEGSDAILTCPACMTTLCIDCQRHSLYQNQYRAMFVMNCNIKYDELLHYKEKQKRQFKRHRKRDRNFKDEAEPSPPREGSAETGQIDDKTSGYHPVKCSVCSTEVGVYDYDEVYHFFNVLSGYA